MKLKVYLNEENRRLDNFLRKKMPNVSLSLIFKLIRKGKVKVNDKVITEQKNLVQLGDIIEINDDNLNIKDQNVNKEIKLEMPKNEIRLDILFENKNIIILNKPCNISVHGDSDSLDNQVKVYLLKKSNGKNCYCTHVHRLDKQTSGCIMYAKSLAAARYLNENTNLVEKTYLAITQKKFMFKEFEQKENLSNTKSVYEQGEDKSFSQKIKLINSIGNQFFLYKVVLSSGKKRQIRAGFALLNNPILGDRLYNGSIPGINRLYLHAYSLRFSSLACKELDIPHNLMFAEIPVYWKQLFAQHHFKLQF